MARSTGGVVVVGVDGSESGHAALRHALREGSMRGASVTAVIAVRPPETSAYLYETYDLPDADHIRAAAQEGVGRWIEAAKAEVGRAARDVDTEAVALIGSPAAVLVAQARDAELLVVGHRGRGRWRSALLGSVGLSVILHAPCAVTVVPGPAIITDEPVERTDAARTAAPTPLPVGPIA